MGTYFVALNLDEKEDEMLNELKRIEKVSTESELFYLYFCEMAKKHGLLSENELTFKFAPKRIKFNLVPDLAPGPPMDELNKVILKPGDASEVMNTGQVNFNPLT